MSNYELMIKDFFDTKEKDAEGYFKIGVCDDFIKRSINANTSDVVMSQVSLKKNIEHHSDLTLDDYRALDNIFDRYEILIKDGENTVGVVYIGTEKYYYALKSTKSGDTIFLTSFRKTNNKDINRLRKKVDKKRAVMLMDNLD